MHYKIKDAIEGEAERFYTDSNPGAPDSEGKNAPLVFVHGFPHTHAYWKNQSEELRESARIITFDLRGHGSSSRTNEPHFMDFFVEDLMGLLDHLKLDRVHLCGLSMGGYTALRAIALHPERIQSLILADTTSKPDTNEAKLKRIEGVRKLQREGVESYVRELALGMFLLKTQKENEPLVKSYISLASENSAETLKKDLMGMAARLDTTPFLKNIAVKTVVIVGEEDKLTPVAAAKELSEGICGAQLEIVKGAGHLSSFEAPEKFNQIVRGFLNSVI